MLHAIMQSLGIPIKVPVEPPLAPRTEWGSRSPTIYHHFTL